MAPTNSNVSPESPELPESSDARAPFTRGEFAAIRLDGDPEIRLDGDPEEAFANVTYILATYGGRPDRALELCVDWIGGYGCAEMVLPNGDELLYVLRGDAYDSTLCYVRGRGFFVSSWGDELELAEHERTEQTEEVTCNYCGAWYTPAAAATCRCCKNCSTMFPVDDDDDDPLLSSLRASGRHCR